MGATPTLQRDVRWMAFRNEKRMQYRWTFDERNLLQQNIDGTTTLEECHKRMPHRTRGAILCMRRYFLKCSPKCGAESFPHSRKLWTVDEDDRLLRHVCAVKGQMTTKLWIKVGRKMHRSVHSVRRRFQIVTRVASVQQREAQAVRDVELGRMLSSTPNCESMNLLAELSTTPFEQQERRVLLG